MQGQSSEQRQCVRFRVDFRSSFATVNRTEGEGAVVDLSVRGCRIRSTTQVKPGTELCVLMQILDELNPLDIAKAAVRWSRDFEFGLEFVDMAGAAWARLCATVKTLEGTASGVSPERRHA